MSSSSDLFNRQTLELTFRVLRNNESHIAFAIKNLMDNIVAIPRDSDLPGEMHLNMDVLQILGAETIVKIGAALNGIAETAISKNNLPKHHIKILRSLIEDWAELAEWILQHTTAERNINQ